MTQEQFLQILPAYNGCKFNMLGVSQGRLTLRALTSHQNEFESGLYKLILRSFDQISDEEYIQFIKVVNPQYNHHPSAYYYLQFRETGLLSVTGKSIIGCAAQINYLRSIGVDCDNILDSQFGIRQK